MAWIAVNDFIYDGVVGWEKQKEVIFRFKPHRDGRRWFEEEQNVGTPLPYGTIEKIIGRKLTFDDEPVEIK